MSRVRCLLCALFLVVVVLTCAVGLRPDPVEISTTVPPTAADLVPPAAAADVAEPAPPASAVVNPVAGEAVDGDVLDVALRDAGVELSPGSSVYAVRLEDGPEGLTYEAFEAGEDATYDGFWPASSVKLAGLGDALLESEGFVEPAVADVLGDSALVFNKPGYVPGDDCVDVAMLADD